MGNSGRAVDGRHCRLAKFLRGPVPGRIGRYILGGLGGLAVSVGVTAFLREVVVLPVDLSFAIALVVVFSFHFAANALFVFRTGTDRHIFMRYTIAALAFRSLDFLLFKGLLVLASLAYPVAIVLAVLASNSVKFLVYSNYVFVKRDDSRPA